VHAGYGTGDAAWHAIFGSSGGQGGGNPQDSLNAANYGIDGFLGGIQAGYNIQRGNIVMGIEGEASWSGMDGNGLGGVNSNDRPFSTDVDFLGTFAARFGLAMNRTLFYGKTGVAIINQTHTHTTGAPLELSGSETRGGWLLGAGVEHAFNERWSIKGEYNYIQFNASDVVLSNGGTQAAFAIDQHLHTFKAGLNYRFSDGGALLADDGGFDWSGAYAGVHAGYGSGDKAWHAIFGVSGGQGGGNPQDSLNAANYGVDGFLGGIQAGYNIQRGRIVMGIEGEASWAGIDGNGLGGVNSDDRPFSTDVNFLGTFTGRFGVAMNRTLFYGETGVAIINESHSHTTGAPVELNGSETRGGWLLGAGVEHAFNDRWSIKGEYNYIQFNAADVVLSNGGDESAFAIDQDMHTFKLGLNFRF
jgi:outer membrane immunogenic protein